MAATTTTTTFTARTKVRPPAGCAKLDGVAMWLINGLTGAFFASLERCSCIRISTYEDDFGDDGGDNLPLIFSDGNYGGDDRDDRGVRRRRLGKGKKAKAFAEY